MNIAIMTDTNSGISPKKGEPLGIKVVPMPVLIDGKVYYEGVNLTAETFYQWLRDGREVTTSQPPPGEVLSCWDELLAEGFDEVLYIPMSSGLSTSFQTACTLAEDYEGRVQVVDHRSVSVPLRYALEDAQNMVRAGHLAGEDIPYAARLIALCDSIDAMLTDRVYRKALGSERAYTEIKRNRGTLYDPAVTEVCLLHWTYITSDAQRVDGTVTAGEVPL